MGVLMVKELREALRNRQFLLTGLLMPAFLTGISVFQFYMMSRAVGARGGAQAVSVLSGTILMMLSLVPMISSQILAAYSFAGEKVQRTLEPLLSAPLSDGEVLAGKLVAAWAPGQLIGWGTIVAFLAATGWFLPDSRASQILPLEIVLLIALVMQPLVGLSPCLIAIIVSSRVSEVRAAMQWGGMAVVPVVLMFVLFSLLGARFGPLILVAVVALLLVMNVVLFVLALALFSRERLISKWT